MRGEFSSNCSVAAITLSAELDSNRPSIVFEARPRRVASCRFVGTPGVRITTWRLAGGFTLTFEQSKVDLWVVLMGRWPMFSQSNGLPSKTWRVDWHGVMNILCKYFWTLKLTWIEINQNFSSCFSTEGSKGNVPSVDISLVRVPCVLFSLLWGSP